MNRSDRALFTCPLCHEPVDPTARNAMKNAATQEWQHKDCWKPTVTPQVESETRRA